MHHDFCVKNAIVNLPIRLKANSKHISSNLYSPLGGTEQGNWHYFADVTNWG